MSTVTSAEIQRAGGLEKWMLRAARQEVTPGMLGGNVEHRPPPAPPVRRPAGVPAPVKAKGRLPAPGRTYRNEGMNQTEARYADHLAMLEREGKVVGWDYEGLKLRLADKTFYTPDFLVIMADGSVEIHEVKGHWEDDARVKIKVAAKQKPWFTFVAVKPSKRGEWEYERF